MTEFYKVTGEKMSRYQKIRNVLLTVIVTLALQCTFEVLSLIHISEPTRP